MARVRTRPSRFGEGIEGTLRRVAWIAALVSTLPIVTGGSPSRPGEPYTLLGNHLGFSPAELLALERGEPIKRSLDESDPREIALAGAVRVDIPRQYFLARFLDIAEFKRGPLVLQVGAFSDPPRLEDIEGLTLPDEDLRDLRRCRPGDCDVKLPAETIRRLRTEVDWSAPDAEAQAARLVKEMLVERARLYLRSGPSALAPYYARKEPVFVSREFTAILDASPYLHQYAPELRSFLEAFPRIGLPASEHLLYWSKETFELKPVVNLTHATLYTPARFGGTLTLIASTGLYSSHYLDASLGLTVAIDADPEGRTCYLVYINRTRVDVLAGAFAGLRRWTAERRARSGLGETLLALKRRLERDYRTAAGPPAAAFKATSAAAPRRR